MRDVFTYILVIGLLWLAWLLIKVHWQEGKEKTAALEHQREIEKWLILLQDICPVWTRGCDGKLVQVGMDEKGRIRVTLDKLAGAWIQPQVVEELEVVEEVGEIVLQNERAAKFFKKLARTPKDQRRVIARLLLLLDKEGGCASVVSQQATQDIETSWDASTYQKLGTVTLLYHTLNVAELIIAKLNEEGSGHMVNDAVIAALGHDIGKLPSKQAKLYSTGDHALTSAAVLNTFPEFKKLAQKDLIVALIKNHHKETDDYLTKILRSVDMKARQNEMELCDDRIAEQEAAAEADRLARPQPAENQAVASPETPGVVVGGEAKEDLPVSTQAIAPPQAQTPINQAANLRKVQNAERDIYGEGAGDSREKKRKPDEAIRELDISQWFDADLCLSEIKQRINVINGNIFTAFSMPTGTVYVHVGLMRDLLMKQASVAQVMEITMLNKNNSKDMQPLNLAAANVFRNRNAIERSLVGENYFGGWFAVNYRYGAPGSGYYLPFTAEAFLSSGESIGELERRKKGRLADIVSVEISNGKNG